jgi:hypothetical protein
MDNSQIQKLALNLILFLVFLVLLIYIFNSLFLAQKAGIITDTRKIRQPQRQHNYFLKSHRVATWIPPWFRTQRFPMTPPSRRCPIGCVFSGRPGSQDQNGFACPNGPSCNSPNCCKYDRDCSNC